MGRSALLIIAVLAVAALVTYLAVQRPGAPPSTQTQSPVNKSTASQTTPKPACSGSPLGYVAPTLVPVVKDAVVAAHMSPDAIQSVGSVEGLRRIQQGSVPDVFASVDIELEGDVKKTGLTRSVYSLGRFKIALACMRLVNHVRDVANLTTALADPNKAPIGYRELALAWMLYKAGEADLLKKYEALGIRFVETPSGVNITVPTTLPPTEKTLVAPNLDATWTKLETGAADCVFTYTAYVAPRLSMAKAGEEKIWDVYVANYTKGRLYIYVFKPPYDFAQDPPQVIYANFVDPAGRVVKTIRVGHFEAFVASFTERGDCVVEALRRMDLAKYGLIR
ncbi:MAG: ABC transporter substrate-binding protein [Pyrobaculum sp.]